MNSQATSNSGPMLSPIQPKANVVEIPKQILHTGINLNSNIVSPNSRQLAEKIGLLPILEKIQLLREQTKNIRDGYEPNKQELVPYVVDAMELLQETSFSIDFVLAEIDAEQNIYTSMLSTYSTNRDKAVFKTNAISFITNGALWAVAEGLDIPTYNRPRYSISSGTNGILAGVVPSFASMYALHQLYGKKQTSEADPNMLAKLFDYPTNPEIEYPKPVWDFLNAVPADSLDGKARRDVLIDRWIGDKNIPEFTDKTSTKQLDVITASVARHKGLSIASLNTRQSMLQQLSSEVLKMKRMLLELSMVLHGEKTI